MMFLWGEDRIRFMKDAAEYGQYNRLLAERLSTCLNDTDLICDAGCGLGHLSLELSKYVAAVDSVDVNGGAIAVLRENIQKRGITNINPICSGIESLPEEGQYDAMVFSFFGKPEDIIGIAKGRCSGKVIAITNNYDTHRFTAGTHHKGHTFEEAKKMLGEHGYDFEAYPMELELGQPFRSYDDAKLFFELYNREPDSTVSDEFVRSRIVKNDSETFPYYMPYIRKMGVLIWQL